MKDNESSDDYRPVEVERDAHNTERVTRSSAQADPLLFARGAVYTRYSTRDQHSTQDQIRVCTKWAQDNAITVDKRHIFSDEGISGRTTRRQGLRSLQAAIEANEVDVVIVFATNRLFRKMYQALRFVEEEILERRKRCVFVTNGIDTADEDDWTLRHQFAAMLDDHVARTNVKHIQAAHVGLLERKRIFGSITYGYTGEVIGGETTRKGRQARRLIIDPDKASWVRKVFDWFTEEGMSIRAITRRLNGECAPLQDKFRSGRWDAPVVRRMLSNERYIGRWSYGVSESKMLSKREYASKVPREQPLGTVQFSDLRIITEITWHKAQARLANNRRAGGRKPNDGRREERPLLLNGIVYCAVHGRPLTANGTYGRYLACVSCKAEAAPALYTLFNRRLGTELICPKVAELLRADETLIAEAIDICRQCADAAERPDPGEIDQLRRKEKQLSRQIDHVLDMPGETEQDRIETKAKVRTLRAQRATVQQLIVEIEEVLARPVVVPDPAEIRERLDEFAKVLLRAAESAEPRVFHAAREFLIKVSGGRIELVQCGEKKAQRGWLRATFQVRLLKPLLAEFGCSCKPAPYKLVTIDIRKPTLAERRASEVRRLYDQGLGERTIAEQLQINRNSVRKALDVSFAAEGKARPDGRSRRWTLSKEQRPVLKAEAIVDDVLQYYHQGMPIQEIATRLNVDRNCITAAVRIWHEERGISAPDGRARRKQLRLEHIAQITERAMPLYRKGWMLKTIAEHLGVKPKKVADAIGFWHRERGIPVPDGRTRAEALRCAHKDANRTGDTNPESAG